MPTGVIPMEKSQYLAFFGSLHLIGVNMLVFEDEGGVTRMPLDEIARLDPKVAEKKEVPMLNTALQLTVIYFIQELRRPNQKKDDMVRMKPLTGIRGRDDCGSGTFPFYSGSGFLQGRG